MPEIYICGASRTPIGSFNGALKNVKAPQLGIAAMTKAMEQAGVKPDQIEEVYFGNVLQAGVGQVSLVSVNFQPHPH